MLSDFNGCAEVLQKTLKATIKVRVMKLEITSQKGFWSSVQL